MSQLRYNLITGDWVILAPERSKRPMDFVRSRVDTEVSAHQEGCPFCLGNEAAAGEEVWRTPESGPWAVRVLPNKYASLVPGTEMTRTGTGYQRSMSGLGRHEVIIETPLHNGFLATQAPAQVGSVLLSWRERMLAFYQDPVVEHVILFKNHGEAAGSSLTHPHSQIYGVPVVPEQVRSRLEDALRFYADNGECVFCHCLRLEREQGERVVAENDAFVAFIPYAALSPYHLWIFPKRHLACFGAISDAELEALSLLLCDVLSRLHASLDDPDYNLVVQSLSPAESSVRYAHWYLSIVPRLAKAAGFELGTGMFINPSLPESSARYLREAKV
ncbi:MAG: galactose-1-phosphate uridylyltransferase [bacterium]